MGQAFSSKRRPSPTISRLALPATMSMEARNDSSALWLMIWMLRKTVTPSAIPTMLSAVSAGCRAK